MAIAAECSAGSLQAGMTELRFEHLRPMGTSDRSWWRGRVRHGSGQYFMGTTPAYMHRQRPVPHDPIRQ